MTNLSRLNSEFSKPYKFLSIISRYTCIDFFNEKNFIVYKIKFSHFFILLLHILNAIRQWSSVLEKFQDGVKFLEITSDLSYAFNLIEDCVVYMHTCLIRKRIEHFVVKLEKQWRSDDTLSTDALLLKRLQVKKLNSYNSGFCIGLGSFSMVYSISPFIIIFIKKHVLRQEDVVYMTLWDLKMGFDYSDSLFKYFIAYAIDLISSNNVAFALNICMFHLAVTLNQLRILFLLLQIDFKEIIQSNSNDIDDKLKKAIQRHTILSELLNDVGVAYGGIYAIRIFFLSVTVCFYGISARINCRPKDFADLVISLLIVLTIFYVTMCGQLTTDAALGLATVVYDSTWEDLSNKNKKMIILIILRSQQAAYVRSTDFSEISLNTFAKIIKLCWSLISLVTNFIDT